MNFFPVYPLPFSGDPQSQNMSVPAPATQKTLDNISVRIMFGLSNVNSLETSDSAVAVANTDVVFEAAGSSFTRQQSDNASLKTVSGESYEPGSSDFSAPKEKRPAKKGKSAHILSSSLKGPLVASPLPLPLTRLFVIALLFFMTRIILGILPLSRSLSNMPIAPGL